jgi:hypothetical protein
VDGDLTRDATKLPGLIKATAGGVHAPALGRVLAHELEAQAAICASYQHHRHDVSLTVRRLSMTRHNLQGTFPDLIISWISQMDRCSADDVLTFAHKD